MRTINFKSVKLANFLSVGNDVVEVNFRSGVHIITGTNKDKEDRRNGVGKSTIADAIHFAVFGTTIREIKKENIINKINRKKCCVTLEFDVVESSTVKQFKVVRTLQPSKCWLYIDGEDRTRDSISNTNSLIQKYLKTTPDIFQNCVIMTINGTTPFLAKNKGEKRKFIENIFNLKVFSDMADSLKTEHNEFKRQSEIEFTKVENLETSLKTQYRQRAEYENEQKTRVDRLSGNIKENDDEIKLIQAKLSSIEIDDEDGLKNKLEETSSAIEKTVSKLKSINENLATQNVEQRNLDTTLGRVIDGGTVCDYCLRPIEDHDHDHIAEEKEKIKSDIKNIRKQIENITAEKKKYDELETLLKTSETGINNKILNISINKKESENYEQQIVKLVRTNEQLEEEKKSSSTLHNTFDDEIKKLESDLNTAKQEVDNIKNQINLMDIVKFVLSEEGVRAFIVKKILQMFNGRLAYYLKRMDANCICLFNEYFEEELFDEKGRECSYFNFSGAERKNLDLACLFTFMDIRRLQGDVSYNISIYDELLDSSLDEKGVDMVIDILRERVEKFDESVMIISHRRESVKAVSSASGEFNNDVIFLEKEKGITRRVEYTE
ncbi:AAA family ATPase [bacterium]|nr:AAA family ATPase [bacterium]